MVLRREWQLFLWRLNQIDTVWWIIIGLVMIVEMLWLWKNRKCKRFCETLFSTALIINLMLILIVTVLSREAIGKNYWNQLISFDISTAWTKSPGKYGAIDTANELMLNILMFLPFGYIVSRLARGRSWIVFSGCFFITFSIEVLQLTTKRGFFELADILLNMIGAVLGYWVYRAAARIQKEEVRIMSAQKNRNR